MNILDLHAGYTNCDICGSGNTTISVEATREGYTYRHRSNCYGNLERTGLTKEQLLELLDEHSFFPHTRHAVRSFKQFRRDVARGAFERFVKPVEEKSEPKAYLVPAPEGLDPVNVTAAQVEAWAQLAARIRFESMQSAMIDVGNAAHRAAEQMLTYNFAYADHSAEWNQEGGM